MYRYFAWLLVIPFLFHSVPGLLPTRLIPHEHLLIGQVTAEQLHAHEEQEAQESAAGATALAIPSLPNVALTPTGGLIISMAPIGEILGVALQQEVALLRALVFPALEFFAIVLLVRLTWWSLGLPEPDPPPRLAPPVNPHYV